MRRLIHCITACGWEFSRPVDVAGSLLSRLKKLLLVVGVTIMIAAGCGGPGANERLTPTPERYAKEELRRELAQALRGLCLEMFTGILIRGDHVSLWVSDWEFVEQELRKAGRTLPPGSEISRVLPGPPVLPTPSQTPSRE